MILRFLKFFLRRKIGNFEVLNLISGKFCTRKKNLVGVRYAFNYLEWYLSDKCKQHSSYLHLGFVGVNFISYVSGFSLRNSKGYLTI